MADELVLTTETGRVLGSRPSRRLRRENKVPGVVYGLDTPPENFAVEYAELRKALTTDAGLNVIIQLEVNGERQLSILKDLQRHPYRDEVLHVDFIRVDPNAELLVDVPVVLEGEARKVTAENGMVDQTIFSLAVFASPTTIPNEIIIDVSEMEINDSIRVGDIALPEGVRTEVDLEETVAIGMVTRSTMESMAEDEAAEAEAEAAEAEDGASADRDDADGGGDE
jgi:large subunit ribosomal protein L25